MNIRTATKTDTRPTRTTMRADDAGMVAYRAARELGADTDVAMAAYLSAHADAMRG